MSHGHELHNLGEGRFQISWRVGQSLQARITNYKGALRFADKWGVPVPLELVP